VLGEAEVARLTAKGARIVQVNVWRPIRGPVQRAPLALADLRGRPRTALQLTYRNTRRRWRRRSCG
jgi:hypothetical protein